MGGAFSSETCVAMPSDDRGRKAVIDTSLRTYVGFDIESPPRVWEEADGKDPSELREKEFLLLLKRDEFFGPSVSGLLTDCYVLVAGYNETRLPHCVPVVDKDTPLGVASRAAGTGVQIESIHVVVVKHLPAGRKASGGESL
jgi:hypothetical protein